MLGGLINGVDSFFIWLNSVLKQNLADYCDLETAQDEYSLVAKDGSLLSIVKINGFRSLINTNSFYTKISNPLSQGLDVVFSKPGHSIQVWFSVDPDRSELIVKNALAPSYETLKRLELDLSEILDERVSHISQRTTYEECYVVLWTLPSALVKSETKQEIDNKKEIRKKLAPIPTFGQDPFAANGMLINQHLSYVDNVIDTFDSIGIACKKLDVAEAARAVRKSVDEKFTNDEWSPYLPGDPIYPHVKKDLPKSEEWDIVWPKLNWQVCPRDAQIINDKLVKVGDTVYAPAYIDLLPKDVQPFMNLFNSISGRFPWRISYMMESDGLAAVASKGLFASILAFTSGNNKLLNNGVKIIRELRDNFNQTVVKIRISLCTWGHHSKITEVEKQLSEMARAVESWGSCIVSEVTGDPLAGMMSTALGVTKGSVGTASAAPLDAMTFMMPFDRPCSPWEKGATLFLSRDGKLMPYQPGSSEQTTWVSLIFAGPGSGKSVLMNVTNLALCIAGGLTRLPRIGIIDIGPSSSGLISLLKEGLPSNKKHFAQYHRIRMTEEFCINPWDTQVGCRFPTAEEAAFLSNFLLLLVTDPNKENPEDGMSGLVNAVVHDMYLKKCDKGQPQKYDKGVDFKVDQAIKKIGYKLDEKTTWWEIVDALFSENMVYEAMLAQRHAVPLLTDAAASAQDDKIREIYSKVKVSTGETLVEYFNRSIANILNQYKILGKPTVFDIGESRVTSLDLDEVAKGGGVAAERQTAVMYMLARYILGKDFKLGVETVNEMPYPANMEIPPNIPVQKYKAYHKVRCEEIKEDFKRLCLDEFHRTSKAKMVRDQVIVDMREGRKWNLDVTLASQSLADFDETMKSFATNIFIMNGGNEKDIENLVNTFGMDDEAEKFYLSKGVVRGPRNGRPGIFMGKFVTNNGKYTQLLSAHIGAIEMWALSTTSEDAAVRTKLYEKIGPVKARKLLAENFPKGLKKVVEDMRQSTKSTNNDGVEDEGVYNQIVEMLLKKAGYK